MSYALVGSAGAVTLAAGNNTAVTPAWGTGESRAAGNLLICWVDGFASTTLPATPAGWSIAAQKQGASQCSSTIFYKVAAGGDAAPTIAAVSSSRWAAQLAEFSGGASSSPLDRPAVQSGSTSPLVATAGSVDALAGELVVAAGGGFYSASGTKTLAHTLNNGATATETTNNSTAAGVHYDFAYGITTGNSSADSDSFAITATNLTDATVAVASFKLLTFTFTDAPSGSLTPSGSLSEAQRYGDAPAGLLALSGSSTEAKRYSDALAGALSLSGSLVEARRYTDAPTESLALSGSLAETRTYADAPSGALTLSGLPSEAKRYSDALAGALSLSGICIDSYLVVGIDARASLNDAARVRCTLGATPLGRAAISDAGRVGCALSESPLGRTALAGALRVRCLLADAPINP